MHKSGFNVRFPCPSPFRKNIFFSCCALRQYSSFSLSLRILSRYFSQIQFMLISTPWILFCALSLSFSTEIPMCLRSIIAVLRTSSQSWYTECVIFLRSRWTSFWASCLEAGCIILRNFDIHSPTVFLLFSRLFMVSGYLFWRYVYAVKISLFTSLSMVYSLYEYAILPLLSGFRRICRVISIFPFTLESLHS